MRERSRSIALSAILVLLFSSLLGVVAPTQIASAGPSTCFDVEAVWARGSGQKLEAKEHNRFAEQLKQRIKSPLTLNIYELGSGGVTSLNYPAVSVEPNGWNIIVPIGAKISAGQRYAYGNSVRAGSAEVTKYIEQRLAACPNTIFILGGYSQGAQVIGEAYSDRIPDAHKHHIVFNMLFGDPKLYLPEGVGFNPPACRGAASPWRRAVPSCDTDNGALGSRKPYLPGTFVSTTGLWCNGKDYICGSTKLLREMEGHGKYADANGPIDQGALEAAQRVRGYLKAKGRNTEGIDTSKAPDVAPTEGQDVVFFIDSTGSMEEYIDSAKETVSNISNLVAKQNGRVGLVEYRDLDDEFTARVLTGLTKDMELFAEKLGGISVDGGGDNPEALLHALKFGMLAMDWRNGATKAAVVLTDDGFHDPDMVDGTTLEDVVHLSLSIDPVNVYPVVPWTFEYDYQELAELTTGQVVLIEDDAATAINDAISRIESRPVPLLPLDGYRAEPGQSIQFDGSQSYSVGSTITQWDWDFDGDGEFEIIDGESTAEHAYPADFDGFVQLRITDANGLVGSYSAPVTTIPKEDTAPQPAESLTVSADGDAATLEWVASQSPSASWHVTVDGYPVAEVEAEARTVVIEDIERSQPVQFGVAPVSEETGVGEAVYAVLEAIEPTEAPTAAPTPTPIETASVAPTSPTPNDPPSTATPSLKPSPSPKHGGGLATTGANSAPILMFAFVCGGVGGYLALRKRVCLKS